MYSGDIIKIIGGKYYNGEDIPSWVLDKEWIVLAVLGDRIIINRDSTRSCTIMRPVHRSNVKLIAASQDPTLEV